MLAQRRERSRGGWSGQEPVHEGVETLGGLFMPLVGEVEGDHRGCALGVSQGALNEPGVHASCEPMGGVRMPEGREAIPSLVMPARCVAMRKAPWTLVRLLARLS